MRPPLALVLALAAPLAFAQTPAKQEGQAAPKARRSNDSAGRAHAKPTPEQIRRFNELQKQQGSGKR